MNDRPMCKCHGEPMLKDGKERGDQQKWACGRQRRRSAANYYAQNRDLVRARQGAHYERNALPRLMRMQLKYHEKRLEQLHEAVTEGGRGG